MREVVRDICAELALVPPFTAEEFRRALQRVTGRLIEVRSRVMAGTVVFGSCQSVAGIFVIYCRTDGSLVQQERIMYHELAHILFGHVVVNAAEALAATATYCDLRTDEEKDAEAFAEAVTLYGLLGDWGPLSEAQAIQRESVRSSSAFAEYLDKLSGMGERAR